MEIGEQLQDMMDMKPSELSDEDTNGDNSDVQDTQGESKVGEGIVSKSDDGTVTKVEEQKKIEEPPKDVETEETLEQINDRLRQQLVEMASKLEYPLKQEEVKSTAGDKQDKNLKQTVIENFLTDEELDRIIDEPNLLNVAFQRYTEYTSQRVAQNLNDIVTREVQKQLMITEAVREFYNINNDLLPYSKYVQHVMSEFETKMPDKTYGEIFEETAKECRKRLGISHARKQGDSSGQQKPAFAGSKMRNSRPQEKPIFDQHAADLL